MKSKQNMVCLGPNRSDENAISGRNRLWLLSCAAGLHRVSRIPGSPVALKRHTSSFKQFAFLLENGYNELGLVLTQ